MPLQLQPAVASDARALTSIFFEAFHPDDPFECLIYPFGPTPKAMEHEHQGILKNFEDPNVEYMKVVDTEIREFWSCLTLEIWDTERVSTRPEWHRNHCLCTMEDLEGRTAKRDLGRVVGTWGS
jgi:hypothetical protein